MSDLEVHSGRNCHTVYQSSLDDLYISIGSTRLTSRLTFGANDKILLHLPAGPPAPPGISLNSLDTGPLTLVPIISPLVLSSTQAVSSNLP